MSNGADLVFANMMAELPPPESPESDEYDNDKHKTLLQSFINAASSMNTRSNGIDEIAAKLKQNGASSGGSLTPTKDQTIEIRNGSTLPEPIIISNYTPSMSLSCVECGVTKNNSEEMEVHIKMEHLNWLPFQCPMCMVERASDAQMREHLYSAHEKRMNKFIYVDNPTAKRKLQALMDKAFSINVTKRVNAATSSVTYSPPSYRSGINKGSANSSGRNTSQSNGSHSAASMAQAAASAIVMQQKEKEHQKQLKNAHDFMKLLDFSAPSVEKITASVSKPTSSSNGNRKRPYVPTSATESITTVELGNSSTDSILASINQMNQVNATPVVENEENDQRKNFFDSFQNYEEEEGNEDFKGAFSLDDLNIDSNSSLASIFAPKKMKLDDVDLETDEQLEGLNPISVLDNVAALFGTPDRINSIVEPEVKKTSSISKKRVLGECSKCQKPVTAGARQMHMFFHLAKDENIFRFRCKHDGCSIEHYRKDQMENHQSKAHGRIDPDMMEDRSLELFQKCQELNHELFIAHRRGGGGHSSSPHSWSASQVADLGYQDLSMDLLGTKNGTIPGPTAAKAEIAYAAQQLANAQRNAQKKSTGISLVSSSGSSNGFGPLKLVPDEDHPLQCRLCGKTMQNRIRGFHILWHMAKDKGINRYTCKYCDFGHDRSQSVQVHGKKEHGADDSVEDRIGEYQDDVKEMSKNCFGVSSLFAQESKRKNKFPAAQPREKLDEGLVTYSNANSPLVILDDEASNDSAVVKKEIKLEDLKMEELETLETEVADVEKMETEQGEEDTEEKGDGEEEEEEAEEEEEEECSAPVVGSAKKKRRRGFNSRAKKSKKQKEEATLARAASILIGGAQFYKKKVNEFCYCEKCGKHLNSRLAEHAGNHIDANLYACPVCDWGKNCKDSVKKHMESTHSGATERIVDNRLSHINEIKTSLKECFPAFFIDHPLPTKSEIEKLQTLCKNGELKIGGIEKYLEDLAEAE